MRADGQVVSRVSVTHVTVEDDGAGRVTTIKVGEGASRPGGGAPSVDSVPLPARSALRSWLGEGPGES